MLSALFVYAVLTPGTTPEDTIQKFVAAFNAGDLVLAADQVAGAKKESEFVKFFERQLKDTKQGNPPKATVMIKKVEIKDLDATVQISTTVEPNGPPKPLEETVKLRKEGEDWKIVAPKYDASDSRSMGEFVNMVSMMLVSSDEAMKGAKDAAVRTARLSNFKQIATAFIMHSTDLDDKMLINTANAKKGLAAYLRNDEIWLDPATKKPMNVCFNPALSNKRMTAVEAPAETVLISWGPKGALVFDESGKTVIAFVDGHVKTMTKEQTKTLRWVP